MGLLIKVGVETWLLMLMLLPLLILLVAFCVVG